MKFEPELAFRTVINDYFKTLDFELVIYELDKEYRMDQVLIKKFDSFKALCTFPAKFNPENSTVTLMDDIYLVFDYNLIEEYRNKNYHYIENKVPAYLFMWKIKTPDKKTHYSYKDIVVIKDNILKILKG